MKEKVFETVQNYRLIGNEVDPPEEFFQMQFGMSKALAKTIYDGVWINRTRINKVTFLSHDEILRVRPLTVFDTEYDPPQGIGIEKR